MNKSRNDILWVGIRFLGLFFLAKALIILPVIPAQIISCFTVSDMVSMFASDAGTESEIKAIFVSTVCKAVQTFIQFLMFIVIGVYLCRKGKLLFGFIKLPSDDEPCVK